MRTPPAPFYRLWQLGLKKNQNIQEHKVPNASILPQFIIETFRLLNCVPLPNPEFTLFLVIVQMFATTKQHLPDWAVSWCVNFSSWEFPRLRNAELEMSCLPPSGNFSCFMFREMPLNRKKKSIYPVHSEDKVTFYIQLRAAECPACPEPKGNGPPQRISQAVTFHSLLCLGLQMRIMTRWTKFLGLDDHNCHLFYSLP